MSSQVEKVIELGEGWALTESSTPPDNQYVLCIRNRYSDAPLLCVYDADSKNFYQVFQKIGKKSTTLNLTIVTDIVAFKPVEGIYQTATEVRS